MSIKQKIKSLFGGASKAKNSAPKKRKNKADSELSADEVAKKQVFPKKTVCNKKSTTKKPPSKRTRPTNDSYEMIDPDHNTCDSGQS